MKGSGGAPWPPKDLAKRGGRWITLRAGSVVWRIHRTDYGPVFFGRTGDYRFDILHRTGVCYAAQEPAGAFVETFGRGEPIDKATLEDRSISLLRLLKDVRLIMLYDDGMLPIGATAEVAATRDYSLSQAWSEALLLHPSKPDGIAFRVRHDNGQIGYAFYEQGDLFEPAAPPVRLIDYPDVWRLIARYELAYHPGPDERR